MFASSWFKVNSHLIMLPQSWYWTVQNFLPSQPWSSWFWNLWIVVSLGWKDSRTGKLVPLQWLIPTWFCEDRSMGQPDQFIFQNWMLVCCPWVSFLCAASMDLQTKLPMNTFLFFALSESLSLHLSAQVVYMSLFQELNWMKAQRKWWFKLILPKCL